MDLQQNIQLFLFIELPGSTLFRILHFEAIRSQFIANLVAGCPILGCLSFGSELQQQVDGLSIGSFTVGIAAFSLALQSQNVKYKGMNCLFSASSPAGVMVCDLSANWLITRAASNKCEITIGELKSSSIAS